MVEQFLDSDAGMLAAALLYTITLLLHQQLHRLRLFVWSAMYIVNGKSIYLCSHVYHHLLLLH